MRIQMVKYVEPKTVEEACSLLSKYKGQGKVLAGGSDLLVMMKQSVVTPQYVVNTKRIKDSAYIREDKDRLEIGALTTLSDIEGPP